MWRVNQHLFLGRLQWVLSVYKTAATIAPKTPKAPTAAGPLKAAPAVTKVLVEVGVGLRVVAPVGVVMLVTIVVGRPVVEGRPVLMGGDGGSKELVGLGGVDDATDVLVGLGGRSEELVFV